MMQEYYTTGKEKRDVFVTHFTRFPPKHNHLDMNRPLNMPVSGMWKSRVDEEQMCPFNKTGEDQLSLA